MLAFWFLCQQWICMVLSTNSHKIPCILCAHLQKGRQAADFAISADRLGPPIKGHWFFSQKEIYYHLFKLFARPIRNVARSASWPAGQSVHCQSSCTCLEPWIENGWLGSILSDSKVEADLDKSTRPATTLSSAMQNAIIFFGPKIMLWVSPPTIQEPNCISRKGTVTEKHCRWQDSS